MSISDPLRKLNSDDLFHFASAYKNDEKFGWISPDGVLYFVHPYERLDFS